VLPEVSYQGLCLCPVLVPGILGEILPGDDGGVLLRGDPPPVLPFEVIPVRGLREELGDLACVTLE